MRFRYVPKRSLTLLLLRGRGATICRWCLLLLIGLIFLITKVGFMWRESTPMNGLLPTRVRVGTMVGLGTTTNVGRIGRSRVILSISRAMVIPPTSTTLACAFMGAGAGLFIENRCVFMRVMPMAAATLWIIRFLAIFGRRGMPGEWLPTLGV